MYPYQQMIQSYPMGFNYQPAATKQEIVKVNGENGARAFNLAPNSSVLMLDEVQPIVWLKTTDGAGYATVTPYTITPYQPEIPVDVKSLEERIERLEGLINESDTKRTKRTEPTEGSY